MEQVIKLTGRIAEVAEPRTGVSQRTGNTWMTQECLFQYYAWSGQMYPSSIVCTVFGEDIKRFNLQPLEENVTVTLSINAKKSADGTRWFNDIRITKVERPNEQAEAQTADQNNDNPPF